MKKAAFLQTEQELAKNYASSLTAGLSSTQAKERLAQDGPNRLVAKKPKSIWQRFLEQFKDFMIIVLIIAAILAGVVAHEVSDSLIILLVVILNAILGVVQEAKSEAAISALMQMTTPHAQVKRNGQIKQLKSDELVVGDLVLLEAGDVVPADIRLLEANSLKIEESALTGESVPVEKFAKTLAEKETPLAERCNMAYAGTNVTYGRAIGMVTACGMQTEVGKIAQMLNETEDTQTPLAKNLNQLGKTLTIMILGICVVVFVAGLLTKQGSMPFNTLVVEMFLVAVSLAVAAIPEGLPAIVTIILALGTQTMARHRAIVRKLPAVETLGATDVICSDKTGTLTQNKMTVEKLFYDQQLKEQTDPIDTGNKTLLSMLLANDAKISKDNELLGDPTETALIQYALDQKIKVNELLAKYPRKQELPFDSDRKLMSTINQTPDGLYVFVKGAPDELLKRVSQIEVNGQIEKFDDNVKDEILNTNKALAQKALRVLAFAYKKVSDLYSESDLTSEKVEQDLVFAGLVGMIDPERPEAKQAVLEAKKAGIQTVMITGDHQTTAQAIATRLGIISKDDSDKVLTGSQLEKISDEDFAGQVQNYRVYARVSPEHKVRIVKAWQKQDKIVAMTGDGVNDAPSLKQADIGIGMGITGTGVSKGASSMILADDNFATIVEAIRQGRKVFSNIQKTILYLMSCNVGEVLTVFMMTMLGWDILAPVQLLWINLVTDTFPAIALGVEPASKTLMQQKPRGKNSTFFSGGLASAIIYQGILEGVLVLLTYLIGLKVGPHVTTPSLQHADALTMAFMSLGLIQLFHAINSKSLHHSIFKAKTLKNIWFNWAILVSAFFMALTQLPILTPFFKVSELDLIQWFVVLASGICLIVVVELVKCWQRHQEKIAK